MYFKDFSSGAMIENIVRRAKKLAIKRLIAGGRAGASAPRTSSRRSTRSTRSTRTCPTRPTRTTGRRSRARRASASSTSARSSSRRRRGRAGRRPVHRAGGHRPVPVRPTTGGDRCEPRPGRVRRGDPQGLGIETEYGIVLRGAGESNPVTASSLLINAYVAELERSRQRRAEGRLGLRGRVAGQRRPGRRRDGVVAARGRDPPGQRRAHQRRPLLRRPRPPRAVHARSAPTPASVVVFDRAAEQILDRLDGAPPPAPARRARRSSSTRTTPTARATPTAATRTT